MTQAVAASPEEVRSLLLANIVLVGGNRNIPGFAERLYYSYQSLNNRYRQKEVRAIAPANSAVRFLLPEEYKISLLICTNYSPVSCAWEGGSALVSEKKSTATKFVTRKEYLEHGSNICATKFDTPKTLQESGGKEVIIDDDIF